MSGIKQRFRNFKMLTVTCFKETFMNDIFSFTMGYIKSALDAKLYTPDTRPIKYANKGQLSLQESNDFIYSLIQSPKPFMAARYGTVELGIIKWRLAQKLGLKKSFDEKNMNSICVNSGFFPRDQKMIAQFADLMLKKSSLPDLLGVLYPSMEEYIIKNFAPQAQIVCARGLEPWYVDVPWSRALERKKVLIIHPFETTILKQYKKRGEHAKIKDNLLRWKERNKGPEIGGRKWDRSGRNTTKTSGRMRSSYRVQAQRL